MGIVSMKKIMRNIKLPKQIGWLIPGLEIKRWFLISFDSNQAQTINDNDVAIATINK